MCGIAGYFSPGERVREFVLEQMVEAMAHRGPDQSGVWENDGGDVGFAHARLAVLDVSLDGRQPMASADGRFTICYNGEVYNHLALRKELSGYPFRSHSDTETILAAFSHWGVSESLGKFVGMFAFALWDRDTRRLFLIRDRLGIKPLYYGRVGSGWVFGSELKALKCHPEYSPAIDRDALTLYFRHNYIPSPLCVFRDTWKVDPGQMVVVDETGIEKREWWSARDIWRAGVESPFRGSGQEAADALEALLLDAVSQRMLSNVPLGAFLSGGIDSSTVVALMQSRSPQKVKTFSIGFHEEEYDEAVHAKAVAEHIGTDHTEFYVTSKDMLSVIPDMPQYWDEPFSDSSQIPTYILSRLARKDVTVSLSGDGGDELFCGYQRYFSLHFWDGVQRIPLSIRRMAASLLSTLPPRWLSAMAAIGPKARWRLSMLAMTDFSKFYQYLVSHEHMPTQVVLGGREPTSAITCGENRISPDHLSQMAFWDIVSYLPDDILTKVDRASMAASLEARVPLLDHRVVEFAGALPENYKVRNGQSKWLLRQVLYKYVPPHLVERSKMGFGVPVLEWLQGDLKEWCLDTLDLSSIRRQGYLNTGYLSRILDRFYGGDTAWCHHLWDILMFQLWHDKWDDTIGN